MRYFRNKEGVMVALYLPADLRLSFDPELFDWDMSSVGYMDVYCRFRPNGSVPEKFVALKPARSRIGSQPGSK